MLADLEAGPAVVSHPALILLGRCVKVHLASLAWCWQLSWQISGRPSPAGDVRSRNTTNNVLTLWGEHYYIYRQEEEKGYNSLQEANVIPYIGVLCA